MLGRAEKKLELDDLTRACSGLTRLGPARRSERARAELFFLLVKRASHPALARGSTQQQFIK
jgi:hypothetical protein